MEFKVRRATRSSNKLPVSETAEYKAWLAAKKRCNNPNNPSFKSYGARGIKVCDEWRNDSRQFLIDMGPKPTVLHTLERVDVDGDYCPENCIWATAEEQNNNKRSNVFVLLEGERMTLAQAARKLKFSYGKAQGRRRRLGWPPSRWFEPVAEVQLVS